MNLYGISGLASGISQGQDDLMRRRMAEMQLANMQAQQQAPGAWLDAMRQYKALNPQDQPAGLAPMPGQASQPAPQVPPPQKPMPQMPAPTPGFRGPMPPQQGTQPYRPLPTAGAQAPQQPQAAPSVPAPPRPQQPRQMPDMYQMADILQKQGITGPRLLYALNYHSGLLSAEGKQQLQELQGQLRLSQAESAALRAQTGARMADTRARGEDRLEALADPKAELMRAQAGLARAKAGSAGGSGGSGGGKGGISPETVDYYARQSLAGDNTWQVGLARGKVGQALIAAVKDRIPALAKESDITPEAASAMKGQRASIETALKDRQKYVSAGNQFVSNFQKQADLVEKYLKPGAAGGVSAINKWIQAGRRASSDPDVAAFDAAIRGLAREHQRIVTGVTSNAQLHASAQQTADTLLNRDMSPQEIQATLKVMREEAQNALESGKGEVDLLRTQLTHMGAASKGKQKSMTDEDKQALEWANANPNDPRAAKIKQKLGM